MSEPDANVLFDQIELRLDSFYLDLRNSEHLLSDPQLPGLLFHFTNPQGLLGIVKQILWASNADFLNDSSEPHHALKILEVALSEVVQELRPGSAAKSALADCWAWAMNEYEKNGPHVYVFCLSEHDDLLSQWRSYGAQGSGYALGFASHRLCQLLQPANGQYLLKIVYEEEDQKKEAKSVFGQIVSIIGQSEEKFGSINDCEIQGPRVLRRERVANLQFVHPRVDKPSVVHFKAGTAAIRPYVELNFAEEQLPIEQVTLGPTLNSQLSLRALRLLLAKCGYPDITLKISTVPYRL